jgi:hypothetical protein
MISCPLMNNNIPNIIASMFAKITIPVQKNPGLPHGTWEKVLRCRLGQNIFYPSIHYIGAVSIKNIGCKIFIRRKQPK